MSYWLELSAVSCGYTTVLPHLCDLSGPISDSMA